MAAGSAEGHSAPRGDETTDAGLGPEWYRRIRSHTVEDAAALIHGALGLTPSSVEKDAVGASHAVYFARLPDGTDCVLRVATQEEQDEGPEVWVAEQCVPLGIPVPHVVASRPGTRDGAPGFTIMRRLAGVPGHRAAFPRPGRWEVLRQMGDYLRAMHSVPARGFGPLVRLGHTYAGSYSSHTEYVLSGFARDLERLPEEVIPPVRRERLRERFEAAAPRLGRATARLLHGDYRLSNVLVEERPDTWHVSGIVDFEMAAAGDPAQDLAYVIYSLRWNPGDWDERDVEAICAGYRCPYPLESELQHRVLLYQVWVAIANLFWDVSFRDRDGIATILRWLTDFETALDALPAGDRR